LKLTRNCIAFKRCFQCQNMRPCTKVVAFCISKLSPKGLEKLDAHVMKIADRHMSPPIFGSNPWSWESLKYRFTAEREWTTCQAVAMESAAVKTCLGCLHKLLQRGVTPRDPNALASAAMRGGVKQCSVTPD